MDEKKAPPKASTPNYASLDIYKKMIEATRQISKVAKNLNVSTGKSGYKAVGEADVLEAVKPIEVALGIYSYPYSREIIETNVFTTASEYKGNVTERKTLFLRVKTVYRFVNTDKPSEFIDMTSYGDGFDSQDKAPGKAMTYSDKYSLLKAYKIETGDDPDKDASRPMETPQTPVAKDNPIGNELIGAEEISTLNEESKRTGILIPQILKTFNVKSLEEMTNTDFFSCIKLFDALPDKKVTAETGIK